MKKIYSIPFGADFIGELKKLIIHDQKPLLHKAIVFSGKRPSLYLKKALAEGRDQPFYPPDCYSVAEFIDYITRKKYYDYTDLEYTDAVWFLYQVIQSLNAFHEHSFTQKGFGEFFYWGRHILDFINQLDIENVSNSRLHALEGNAEIGYDVPESVNELLMNIGIIRDGFHETLAENQCFTGGYKHLCALEAIGDESLDEFEKVYFAGLFALSGTEREIIRNIWLKDKGEIIFEGNPDNWRILKELIPHFGAEVETIDCIASKPEHIQIYSAFDAHSEVLKIHSILNAVKSNKAAVVLPLSESLFPLLTFAVDRTDKRYNISLQYPFARTSVFDLIEQVINAQMTRRGKEFYSAKGYLHVILNPFVKNLHPDIDLRALLLHVERSLKGEMFGKGTLNKPFITLKEIETETESELATDKYLNKIHKIFFKNFENVKNLYEIVESLEEMLEYVLNHTPIRSYILSGEIFKTAFEFSEKLKQAKFCRETFSFDDEENKKTLYDFTLNYLKTIGLPFETKPIEELEIIGMLETRNLSFDTVIMLDVNEGIMPQPKKVDPLVPLGVYEGLGIPTPEYNEEIYRYHFYRLINSAKNVHLLYIDAEDKQRSRYIEQVLWEKEKSKKVLNAIPVESSSFKINLKPGGILPEFKKSIDIIRQLKNKMYSPSSIDDFIVCPVLFYFKHILNFEQKKEISGDIDALDRGTIIHRILLDTFEAFKDKEITGAALKDIIDRMNEVVEERFKDKVVTGDYYLFKRLTAYKLESFLRKNIREAGRPFIIKHLEAVINDAAIDSGDFPASLKGRIDRIDYYPDNGEYIIMDYKTGGSKQYSQSIVDKTDFYSLDDIHRKVNSFQLPMYVYLFLNTHPVSLDRINAKLILLKSNEEEMLFKDSRTAGRETVFAQFMKGLKTVLEDMLNISKPFKPFDDEACAVCPFKNLCHV